MNNNISVIIPFYNSSATLPKMLDSILTGRIIPSEIILVNDGSNDSSEKIAREYAEKHSFIRVISQSNQGVSIARNTGLSQVHGQWISFLDADDYIDADMYSKMLSAIESATKKVDGCICGYYTHKNGITTPYVPDSSKTLSSKKLLKSMFTDEGVKGFLFTRLFSAVLLKGLTFDSGIKLCEDLLFQTKLFSSKEVTFASVKEPLYHYIQNEQSATSLRSFFDNETFVYKPAYDQIAACVREDYITTGYNSILDFSMYTLLKTYQENKSPELRSEIRLLQKEMKNQKVPSGSKSKRRHVYELCPILFSYILK